MPHNPAMQTPDGKPAEMRPAFRKPFRRGTGRSGSSPAGTDSTRPSRKTIPPVSKPIPVETYRVEGIGRKGVVRHVKVVGSPGKWEIFGLNDLHVEVKAGTVKDVLRIARRKIPFRPVAVRKIENTDN